MTDESKVKKWTMLFLLFWTVCFLGSLTLIGLLVWVIWHFLAKIW